ncbi:MAG: D-alanine--D-alanine ligase [Candidatus Auribacterota bacterium]|jgi:D-alanine-D-alanine ligase|nr:D-alanine--D-alanine ligase [Candidatus Auribacterota bacterium]
MAMSLTGFLNVAVLMGGPSWEHDISLKSATTVINHCDPKHYKVTPVVVGRDGLWFIYPDDSGFQVPMTDFCSWMPLVPSLHLTSALSELRNRGVDICFIAMHGAFGEDGTLQGALEAAGFAYTGSSVIASSVAMDKIIYKQVLMGAKITVPKAVFMHRPILPDDIDSYCEYLIATLGMPCVVKAPSSGSSIGVSVCRTKEELALSIGQMYEMEGRLLFEEYIQGREFTCAVLGNAHSSLLPLPVTEIISSNSFFDFDAKYRPGGAREITPADIHDDLRESIQQVALAVHTAINCQGMSRTDVLVRDDTVYVLETNTIPGMTDQSLLPKAAQAAGYSLYELISLIISYGQEHFSDKHKRLAVAIPNSVP